MSEQEYHQQQLEQQEKLQDEILEEAWYAILTANCLPIEMVEKPEGNSFVMTADGRTFKISIEEQ